MKQITPNVYVEDQFSVPRGINPKQEVEGVMLPPYRGSNHSFVTTSEGIVMIDSPMFPTDAVTWRYEMAKRGKLRYLINTDSHTDHTSGNYAFEEIATVVSSEGIKNRFPTRISEHNRLTIEEYDPAGKLLLEYWHPNPPTVTFTEKLTLYVGKHTFELMRLDGHQQYHIGVLCPQERVFFAGDNFTYRTQPAMSMSTPLEWVETLKKLKPWI